MRTNILGIASVSLVLFVLAGSARAANVFGRVCIPHIPVGERWDANETGAREASTFTIQMDKLRPVVVTTNASGVLTNLSLAREHLVSIRVDGKPLTSFRFSFKGRGDHLRLWYNPFYGSWSLSDVRPGEKCGCPASKTSNQAASGNGAITSLFRVACLSRAVPEPTRYELIMNTHGSGPWLPVPEAQRLIHDPELTHGKNKAWAAGTLTEYCEHDMRITFGDMLRCLDYGGTIASMSARCRYVRTGRDGLGWKTASGCGFPFVMDRADWEEYLREHHSYTGS